MWVTKKKLRNMLSDTEEQLCQTRNKLDDAEARADYYERAYEATECLAKDHQLALQEQVKKYDAKVAEFPFSLGDTLYQVLLRSANGRFTKKKPSLAHSTVVAVEVDKKNYFKLLDAFNVDYFASKESAAKHLEEVCGE